MTRYLIDCDPGHDDAVAILFAARHLELVGLTTTHGNSSVENTTRNALAICEIAELDLPVAKGSPEPLSGRSVSGAVVHGKSGLEGANLPEPRRAMDSLNAVDFICAQAKRYAGELVIIATGPLTNLARALAQEPDLPRRLQAISLMGGAVGQGNVTPAAEFNIYCDPEAAAAVFGAGVPIHMVGLNVTHQVGIEERDIALLARSGGVCAKHLAGALRYYLERQELLYGRRMAPMHDVCACLPFTHPQLIGYQDVRVEVETRGEHTRGMTVCDFRGILATDTGSVSPGNVPNARVAVEARGRDIINVVTDALVSYR